MSEWQLEPPMPEADELALTPEIVQRLQREYEVQCEGAWRDLVREVFTDSDALGDLMDEGETLYVTIAIPLQQALQALSQ